MPRLRITVPGFYNSRVGAGVAWARIFGLRVWIFHKGASIDSVFGPYAFAFSSLGKRFCDCGGLFIHVGCRIKWSSFSAKSFDAGEVWGFGFGALKLGMWEPVAAGLGHFGECYYCRGLPVSADPCCEDHARMNSLGAAMQAERHFLLGLLM